MEAEGYLIARGCALRKIKLVLLAAASFVCLGCVSMARIDGPYRGRVVDAETDRPIAGAVVHATWYKVALGGASRYYDSYEILSDSNGEFDIPGKGLLFLSEIDFIIVTIFKTGYEQVAPSYWQGLKHKSSQNIVTWDGEHAQFKLHYLAMEQRKKRNVTMPTNVPTDKQVLLRLESNKESMEIGLPSSSLY